ncbi:hypothetical protein M099_2849 [Phocaeicola vulgatus str. 3975 RP4]|uniref:Uncharacterized protein n=1 Tax=Phocaeicola vulgatus str. 3975 RP4 TaxID=1339352 RepID=A0A069SGM5_PHOVU|nr:hypothetical protein M099_2849 [Phocaeicola vulgatus str. 3975 RP4]
MGRIEVFSVPVPSGDKTVSSFVIHKLLSQLHTSLSAFYGYS